MPVILDELLLLKEASIEIMSVNDALDYAFSGLLNAMPNLERLSLSLFMRRETKGGSKPPRFHSSKVSEDGDSFTWTSGVLKWASSATFPFGSSTPFGRYGIAYVCV
ncbi:unnamed protein product [Urochloa humidicola]